MTEASTEASSAAPISPGSEKSRREAEAWAAAIAGLAVVDDRLVVTESAASTDVDAMMAFLAIGEQQLNRGARTAAVHAYRQAVQAAPTNALPYLALGRAFLSKGKVDLALATYAAAIDLEPTETDAHLAYAETLGRQGRYADALDAMARTLDVDPTVSHAHKRSAVWSYYLGDHAAARRHAERAAALGDPVPPQLLQMLEDAK